MPQLAQLDLSDLVYKLRFSAADANAFACALSLRQVDLAGSYLRREEQEDANAVEQLQAANPRVQWTLMRSDGSSCSTIAYC